MSVISSCVSSEANRRVQSCATFFANTSRTDEHMHFVAQHNDETSRSSLFSSIPTFFSVSLHFNRLYFSSRLCHGERANDTVVSCSEHVIFFVSRGQQQAEENQQRRSLSSTHLNEQSDGAFTLTFIARQNLSRAPVLSLPSLLCSSHSFPLQASYFSSSTTASSEVTTGKGSPFVKSLEQSASLQ